MNRITTLTIALLVAILVFENLMVEDVFAQRRGGGGGRSISRPSASSAPSMTRARPQPAASNRPSISRPNPKPAAQRPTPKAPSRPSTDRPQIKSPSTRPNINKPSLPDSRPKGGNAKSNLPDINRPNVNRPDLKRPDVGKSSRPNLDLGNRPGNSGNSRPNFSANRPSSRDLSDFLDLPGSTKPSLPSRDPNRPNPGNRLPEAGKNRPELADRLPNRDNNRPNIGDQSKIGDRTKIGDGNTIGDRTKIGNQIGDRNRVGDININAGNNLTINRQNNVNSIRNRWSNVNVNNRPFNPAWRANYPTTLPAWRWQAGWNNYPARWYWRPCTWTAFGTWFAWSWARPISYNYGSNVVYQGDTVYVDNQAVATSVEYYEQAETIANSIPETASPEEIEWLPLGVYAIAEETATDSGMLIQLAVSKEGIIAGTFYNDVAGTSRPLEGMVDKESQRVALRFADGKNTDILLETMISNLTEEESTALVHFGADQHENWLLVRLPEPEDG